VSGDKPMELLRALFGPDIAHGDTIVLDGAEEPSGRVGFTLTDKDGEVKRCGVTPAVVERQRAPYQVNMPSLSQLDGLQAAIASLAHLMRNQMRRKGQLDNKARRLDSLRERLHDWTDTDVAQYHMGMVLGALPPPSEAADSEGEHFRDCKPIFWTRNGLGDFLLDALEALAKAGVLEKREYLEFRFAQNPPTEESEGR